jgi:hypothetical protein
MSFLPVHDDKTKLIFKNMSSLARACYFNDYDKVMKNLYEHNYFDDVDENDMIPLLYATLYSSENIFNEVLNKTDISIVDKYFVSIITIITFNINMNDIEKIDIFCHAYDDLFVEKIICSKNFGDFIHELKLRSSQKKYNAIIKHIFSLCTYDLFSKNFFQYINNDNFLCEIYMNELKNFVIYNQYDMSDHHFFCTVFIENLMKVTTIYDNHLDDALKGNYDNVKIIISVMYNCIDMNIFNNIICSLLFECTLLFEHPSKKWKFSQKLMIHLMEIYCKCNGGDICDIYNYAIDEISKKMVENDKSMINIIELTYAITLTCFEFSKNNLFDNSIMIDKYINWYDGCEDNYKLYCKKDHNLIKKLFIVQQ